MDPEDLMHDYLERLETAAARLPRDRRAELVADVREHIALALAEAGATDEATVRNVLGRLGSPDEIVAAETVAAGPGFDRPGAAAGAVTMSAGPKPDLPGAAGAETVAAGQEPDLPAAAAGAVIVSAGPEPDLPAAAAGAETGSTLSAPDLTGAAASPPSGDGRPPLSVETRALLLLTVGAAVLPFLGPLLGLWFVSASGRWSLTQKRTAVLIVVVLLALPAIFVIPAVVAGELTAVVTSLGFLLPFIPSAGFLAAAYLVASTSLVVTVTRRS